MDSLIVVSNWFDGSWPYVADAFHALWAAEGPVEFVRLEPGEKRPLHLCTANTKTVTRLAAFGVRFEPTSLEAFSALKEAAIEHAPPDVLDQARRLGVRVYVHTSEGFWGQSVAEFGLALTLCGLRRIPQDHHAILTSLEQWEYAPAGGVHRPGQRGHQYGDDRRFANGTLYGKRVRVVGAGNIASRYASFADFMGADVAAWDPFASEPCFHRAGARKEWHLERLVRDADIFAPMLPLKESTRGLITASLVDALPKGCLVVLVTRAGIMDCAALRRRVLADELALAADVFDVEPLPLNDPLLGRHNVVHTPHNAGRTRHANEAYAQALAAQFQPRSTPLA